MSKDLTAQDIKRIRRKYGLTQQGFARLLGLGEASVVRYENGQTPSKANANLIRAADNPAFMRDCFERDGDLLSHEQRSSVRFLHLRTNLKLFCWAVKAERERRLFTTSFAMR